MCNSVDEIQRGYIPPTRQTCCKEFESFLGRRQARDFTSQRICENTLGDGESCGRAKRIAKEYQSSWKGTVSRGMAIRVSGSLLPEAMSSLERTTCTAMNGI
jgi:hypothetical protein